MILYLFRLFIGCIFGKETIEIDKKQFFIKKRLGEGGFSVVYLVEECRTGKLYALKRVACHSSRDERRILAEIDLHNKLADSDPKNPNIIPLEDYCSCKITAHRSTVVYENEGNLIIDSVEYNLLLPYFRRGTLAEELAFRHVSKDHIAERRVIKLFYGICNAVRAFHKLEPEPFAHRDIKPGNVLLSENDDAVLMDFGSASKAKQFIKDAKEAQALKDNAAEQCSMPYRAPELFHVENGGSIDEKSDIWSLGCLLYAICFFKSPFDQVYERGDSVALAVLSGNIQVPNTSPYSAPIHQLILDSIQVDPAKRPDIDSMMAVLEKLLPVDNSKNNC